MSLRHALLALLSAGPLTGYDASRQFGSSVGHVWHALDSQIYPELRKMQAEGLLTARQVPWGTKGATKTEYSVSPEGYEALRAWQREPLAYVPVRNPARLKAAYFEWADPGDARRQLESHIAHFEHQRDLAQQVIDEIRSESQPTLQRRLSTTAPQQRERIMRFKEFAHGGTVDQAEQEIAWARRGLALLNELGDLG
ncbi:MULTISPECIES: PadR family transcriptional regulator [Micrococcaceae]|uniref:PadR family transcriptional regulator n=1 Tax=Micrococcaceae TaxID=1268 RepID=UPI001616D9A9|nr:MULTISPECIES: PadR family transcriptional regulator [Micrococcaceae]MBB5748741.1 DNA-binding PadR family transcriptional regulator [Micrococcus sp. TA1]HRO29013.1 PadR family transcriptional regulator [Citricoccus sp.]HRO95049.1 PadR family transcriptional regulator [Citricoccus sp.]